MEYKLKFENGRSCEIYCESDGKPLQDKINAAEERFGSQVKTINGKEVKEHGLGGFLVGAIIGGLAGNAVAKKGVKKTIKSVARKTTSTVKRAVDSVKKKEAPKSKRSNYIPNRLIDSIETKSGKTIENKDIIDGAHTKSNVLVSRKRVDSQPKDIDKSKKLSIQADYLSARKIKLVNTTYGRKLKGSEILDGAYVKKGVFADGGSIDSFNWNKFTIQDLVKVYPDIQLAHLIEGGTKYISNYKSLFELEKIEFKLDRSHRIEFQRGDENYYLDIPVQKESSKLALGDMYTITLYTKDNPIGLKKIATTLVEKFKDGGSTESRPNFSSMSKEELIDYSKKNNIPYATGWSTEKLIDTIEDTLDSRYAKGGGVDSKRYKVIIYHGGEQRDQVKYASTLDEARELSFQGEHSEIVDTKTNTLVYGDGGSVKQDYRVQFINPETDALEENIVSAYSMDDAAQKVRKQMNFGSDVRLSVIRTNLGDDKYTLEQDKDGSWQVLDNSKDMYVDRVFDSKSEAESFIKSRNNQRNLLGFESYFAKGGVVLDWKYDKSKGKWRVAVYDPVNETAIAFFDRDEEAENYIVKKKLNKLDRYFSQLQKPDVVVKDKGIFVFFMSKYNYEISIAMKFNRTTGIYEIGEVSHSTDEWQYEYESITEVGGFENNSKDFELLKSTTESIVINSLKFNGIVSNSDQENYLKSDLEKQLQLLFETWKGLSSKKMSNGGTTDKKYYVVDAFKLVQGASKPIVASFNSFAEAKQDAKSRNSSYDPDTKPFIVKDAKYLKSEGVELFEGGGKLKWADARKGDSARVVAENKMGMIVKDYGRKFHLKFPDGTEKTYDATELEFYKLGDDYDEYAKGGGVNGGSIDDYTKNLARVKVKFSNPKYDYTTSVSGEISESDARKYFVGNMFDRGTYPRENMQRVIDIEFYPKGTYAKGGGVGADQFQTILNRAKKEIIEDIKNGTIDGPVNSFSDLHEFVDPNEYGGLTEPDYKISKDFIFENKLHASLDKWIKSGGLNKYANGGGVGSSNPFVKVLLKYGFDQNEHNSMYFYHKRKQYIAVLDTANKKIEVTPIQFLDADTFTEFSVDKLENYLIKKGFKKSTKYAKGGLTEHGLRLGDEIIGDSTKYNHSEFILVEDKKDKNHFVNLFKGERGKAFAKGGVIGQEITFNHWSGDVKRGTIDDVHSTGEYIVQSGFGSMLVNPDDVISISSPEKEKRFLGIFEDGGFVPSGYVVVIANNERLEFPAKYHFDEATQKESLEDIDFEGSPDYKKLYNFISKEFNEWIENSRDYEDMYYGDGDQPAMFNKSGAIWDAIHTVIYEDLVQKKKEGKPAVINLDKYESDFISAFEYKKGGKLKYAKGGSVESSLLTAEENNMLRLILEHPIFKGYKEIQTFTSGGGNYHTMILLSNNHVVTINYESEDIQYSFDSYDSIDQYLDPEAFPGEEKGWDNEYYTLDSESRTANVNLDNIPSFFNRMMK